MYAYIKGPLIEANPGSVIIEAQGIGFSLLIPLSLFGKLPPLGTILQLYTSHIVREDSETLYGFLTRDDKKFFEDLVAISGIGPKTALNLVGHMPLADLHAAIQGNQVQKICKIPGIGKKTAERLIVELRDTLKKKFATMALPASEIAASSLIDDATSALIHLGYNPALVEKTLQAIVKQEKAPLELSALITAALRTI